MNEDYESLRLRMVERQIRARGVRDERVLEAMRKVPRHVFVPPDLVDEAYEDHPLSIGKGQTISQPYMVALMTEALELEGNEKVLEVGTGSGYQTAILAELAREVYSIERIPELAREAERRLEDLGYTNVHIKVGNGTLGWPEEAPFDAIMVTAGAPKVPGPLKAQLADGGRLVIPVGSEFHQILYRVKRQKDTFSEEALTSCVFVPLVGEEGW
ncbi:MAG: protein-L-isoaspartate O-methyltransferase [Candidatus Latescibacterota bacterium]|nr:MAG: protein-L-isoaspartate O-methyltransferase [Candidatus Latescibacterota bacterium]RKY67229.1 MAG: protein-L-isoaspartate O-methyltransferase [Candidatus Latescibacterota bacterium]